MGIYFNPGSKLFREAISSKIYVDKTGLLAYTNSCLNTGQKYLCVSRPRRFGKSTTANMLAAYYGMGEDTSALFSDFAISRDASFPLHRNRYHVISLNMQSFLSRSKNLPGMLDKISLYLCRELLRAYPDIDYMDPEDLVEILQDIHADTGIPFVFIIDEWDCIFRERKQEAKEQKQYLDFLRLLLKDQSYVALAYMTGILPVKKYGTHSALNMFDEYSMTNPAALAEYVGFTQEEVKELCGKFGMNFEEAKRWYDGYSFPRERHVYSPRSVVQSMLNGCFDTYWNQTETFDALRTYIVMNFDRLQDSVTELLAGGSIRVDTGSFSNDMTTFHSADDVLTLLIHLGYLAYDFDKKSVHVPNKEVAEVFAAAIKTSGWSYVAGALENSDRLLRAIWKREEETVAAGIEAAHLDTSILTYNDENSLSCTIALALYCAEEYYLSVREMPAGKGFADIVYLPRPQHVEKPALVVELKWNRDAEGAIRQIQEKQYPEILRKFAGKILLVGVNYDKKTKKHTCRIEEV